MDEYVGQMRLAAKQVIEQEEREFEAEGQRMQQEAELRAGGLSEAARLELERAEAEAAVEAEQAAEAAEVARQVTKDLEASGLPHTQRDEELAGYE